MTDSDRPAPFLPVLFAWLVPGAGHLRIGRPWPALFIAGSILPLFVGGMLLAGGENVSPDRHPWYFGAHACAGLPAAIAAWLSQGVTVDEPFRHASVGQLYSAMAGLLNLVAIADCWARCKRGDPEEAVAALAEPAGVAGAQTADQPENGPGPIPETPLPETPHG